jgi:hypothetical protein
MAGKDKHQMQRKKRGQSKGYKWVGGPRSVQLHFIFFERSIANLIINFKCQESWVVGSKISVLLIISINRPAAK